LSGAHSLTPAHTPHTPHTHTPHTHPTHTLHTHHTHTHTHTHTHAHTQSLHHVKCPGGILHPGALVARLDLDEPSKV